MCCAAMSVNVEGLVVLTHQVSGWGENSGMSVCGVGLRKGEIERNRQRAEGSGPSHPIPPGTAFCMQSPDTADSST